MSIPEDNAVPPLPLPPNDLVLFLFILLFIVTCIFASLMAIQRKNAFGAYHVAQMKLRSCLGFSSFAMSYVCCEKSIAWVRYP